MKSTFKTWLATVGFAALLSGCVQETMEKEITFRVDMRHMDAVQNPGIRGDIAPFSWNESLPLEDPDQNGIYTATLVLKTGQPGLDFKCTLGDDTFELKDQPNRNLPFQYVPQRLEVTLKYDQRGETVREVN